MTFNDAMLEQRPGIVDTVVVDSVVDTVVADSVVDTIVADSVVISILGSVTKRDFLEPSAALYNNNASV